VSFASLTNKLLANNLILHGRRVRRLAKQTTDAATIRQEGTLTEQRNVLLSRIRAWEQLAPIYMPGLLQHRADLAALPIAVATGGSGNPEDIDLWLPSAVAPNSRAVVCQDGLAKMEDMLRMAQCQDALNGVRNILKIKTRMIAFKNRNVRGQRQGTRSRAVIDRVHERARVAAGKYRAARAAKMKLVGPGKWEETLRVLTDGDIRGYQDANRLKPRQPRQGITEDGVLGPMPTLDIDVEPEGQDNLLFAEARTRRDGTGETRRTLSWIWLVASGDTEEHASDEILRVEWAKSRARTQRATEEVYKLKEEMRRVLETLKWEASNWISQADLRSGITSDLAEGIKALSLTQASIKNDLANHFRLLWKSPLEDTPDSLDASVHDPDADDDDEDGDEEEISDGDGEDDLLETRTTGTGADDGGEDNSFFAADGTR